jgi:hypothetical protein
LDLAMVEEKAASMASRSAEVSGRREVLEVFVVLDAARAVGGWFRSWTNIGVDRRVVRSWRREGLAVKYC